MNQPQHLDRLYQEVILEHNKKPRNFREMQDPDLTKHGKNPLCGDDYYIFIRLAEDKISEVTFQGTGCAISKASASIMTTMIKGKTIYEAMALKDCFLDMVTKASGSECSTCLGALKVFEGVKNFPARVKCAALIWRALESALESPEQTSGNIISTE